MIKKTCFLPLGILTTLMALMPLSRLSASVANDFTIPSPDASGRVGALMPYTRYDSETAILGGGASLKTSANWERMNLATQASRQSYVSLPSNGSYAEWTVNTTGAGVTMRFTMPDSGDGFGLQGSLDVYVNGRKMKTVNLTSYYMYQYFADGNPNDANNGGAPAFAFDEVHFLLDNPLRKGDKIRIQSTGAGNLAYGVDFLEIENVPAEIEQPDNSINICDFGATPDDNTDDYQAIYNAMMEADRQGKDLYIPTGTFHVGQIWRVYGSDMKITGAGMWYTNIQFTSDKAGGGGISGGWQTSGQLDGYCSNIEFCHMYINSNLRSRYHQQAVYKCFMDVWTNGSVIHDIWQEHFECGFWFGDYNGRMDYSDGVKVVNCRIRNNLADGVNFCQGTSNAAVYNCSIRNNGDDGLACWNNNYMNAKDETDNIFAYNTIDLIWRAGGIAIYGGNGHKIYNNYICDMYLAAGIHLNSTFDGYRFSNNKGIIFENNILIRCGTNADCWREDLAAVDLKQDVRNVTFNNTRIFDSPFDAIRIMTGPTNITFNNTEILGSARSGGEITYSSVAHSAGAIRLHTQGIKFNGMKIANAGSDRIGNNRTFPIWTDNNETLAQNIGAQLLDISYIVPDYPAADTNQGGGMVNPIEGITGYDVQLVGLAWENKSGSTNIHVGDEVRFTALIKNNSSVDIPAGVPIGLRVKIDETTSFVNTSYKGGLKAGTFIKLSTASPWISKAGGHTVVAEVDYANKLPDEMDENNNSRTKNFNVNASSISPSFTPVSGGYDLQILSISYGNNPIKAGDRVVFSATVVNAGDRDIPAGITIGIQFQIDGNTSVITWCDNYSGGLKSHESVLLTANGGTYGNAWTAIDGNHVLMGWVDDINRLTAEVREDNNRMEVPLQVPFAGIKYMDNPDTPDNLDTMLQSIVTGVSILPIEHSTDDTYYTIGGVKVSRPTRGIYIHKGKKVIMK